ncbi:CoA transferase [Dactylosporangium sp. CA-092794]|uniref:CaiB/BaiF CoA-transferase family protein n=1 Tax=Dactylosporangium sp. CA-092794 TaxID=3239929 RepID=UPI003D8D9AB0
MTSLAEPVPPRALDGIRVVDLTGGVAGPLAAMHLADFGAEVVMVEPPQGSADRTRPGFAMWGRNKRSVVVDPGSPEDLARLRALIDAADVVVTNAFDGPYSSVSSPESTRANNPRLVHLQLPAFLGEPRWSGGGESADLVWALSGMCLRQSSFEGGPVDNVIPYILYIQGAWAAAAATAALIERETSGHGQVVTVGGLHATMVAYAYIIDPEAPEPVANYGPGGLNPTYTRYRCADGHWVLLAALTAKFTREALRVLGLSHVLDDERVNGDVEAVRLPENRSWIRGLIAERFATRTSPEWIATFGDAGVPIGPLLDRDDWMDSPMLDPIGARLEIDDPERGRVVMPANPINLVGTPATVRWPAPPLGARISAAGAWTPRTERAPEPPVGISPLTGTRVLDLGTVLAGPLTGTLLSDMGADVVKVEVPAGDDFRLRGMPYIRGQRGAAIDLKSPEGLDAFHALVRTSDVVVDNYRAGVLKRLKIDYDHLKAVNPDIITMSITGYGEDNEFSSQAAFDPLLQARSGMMTAQGGDSEPVMSTVGINDVVTAACAALGVVLALFHRRRGGGGQKAWLSLTGSSTYAQCEELIRVAGRRPPKVGGRDYRGPGPADSFYRTRDGWVRLRVPDGSMEMLCRAMGVADAEAATLGAAFAAMTREEALQRLTAAAVPAVPARRVGELLADPEYKRCGVFDEMKTADGKLISVPGRYVRFSRSQHDHPLFPPGVGEHTTEVLREAGLPDERIAELLERGAVREGRPMAYRTFAAYYR